jgi:hypothetical protein
MDGPVRRGSFVLPVILIVAGIVFLLNNLGMLGWDVWPFLWRLWPVVLIAWGVDLMLGRRWWWGSMAVGLLLLAVLSGSVWIAATRISGTAWQSGEHVIALAQPLGTAAKAEVRIQSDVAILHIGSHEETGTLVRGKVSLLPGERLDERFGMEGDTAVYRLRSDHFHSFPRFGDHRGDLTWDLLLASHLPLDLHISTGVGKADIDLSRLMVTELKISTGVGKATIRLPAKGRLEADIDIGVGETTIYIPREMAARIKVKTGVGGTSVTGDFRVDGSTYTSPHYATATERAEISVSGGVGKVSIIQR